MICSTRIVSPTKASESSASSMLRVWSRRIMVGDSFSATVCRIDGNIQFGQFQFHGARINRRQVDDGIDDGLQFLR